MQEIKDKVDIRSITLEEIKEFFIANGEKAFRAKQVYEWLWKKSTSSFDQMTNLSKSTRQLLEDHFVIHALKLKARQKSSDKTIKLAFELYDDSVTESVLIPTESRATACISSQTGCSLGCSFCATAQLGKGRNLSAGEIYDQVVAVQREAEKNYNLSLSNIVLMGMGEPLLNYNNVMYAIDRITSEDGLGISPKRITLSTVGLPKMIKKMADDGVKFNLAVSLHAANDQTRSKIMPVNIQNPLSELAEAIIYFYKKTQMRITFEYLLLKNVNDSIKHAQDLAKFCKNVPCKINIIEYNPVEGKEYEKTPEPRLEEFVNYLEKKNLIIHVRRSRGKDIDAACGQLANKSKKS